jgi:hypothetical protein
MEPHQKHFRAKMRKHGWMDEADQMIWPPDVEGRQKMARGLFGYELVSDMDNWILIAEDELDDTYQARWARLKEKVRPEATRRREIFKSLKPEQREAVREMLHDAMKGQLHSFCVALDQILGGSTILLEHPDDNHGDCLKIHSPSQDELKHELFQWFENFSIIFGEDERYGAAAQ